MGEKRRGSGSCGAEGREKWGHWEGIGEKPPLPEALVGAGSTPAPSKVPLLLTAQFPRTQRVVSRVSARGRELLRETSGIRHTISPQSYRVHHLPAVPLREKRQFGCV